MKVDELHEIMIEAYRRLVEEVGPVEAADLCNRMFRERNTAIALALLTARDLVSASTLMDLGIPQASAYRSLQNVRRLGLIEPGEIFQASTRGGPRTRLWRLRR